MTASPQDQAFEEAADELATLGPLRELARELHIYPVKLLVLVCGQHDLRGGPVPDHALKLLPYLGETALKALADGGYLARQEDVPYAISAYVPTAAGRALAARVTAHKRRPRRR